MRDRPTMIAVVAGASPVDGSEIGKGWTWLNAIGKHFRPLVVCAEGTEQRCRDEPVCIEQGWEFFPTEYKVTDWSFPRGYLQYHKWLGEAYGVCEKLTRTRSPSYLQHVIIGSFRMLPAYQKLKLPYVLGPLGGGEYAPAGFIGSSPLPTGVKLLEWMRPFIHRASILMPGLRRTISRASLSLATTEQTAEILRFLGSRNPLVVFPDKFVGPEDDLAVQRRRRQQVEDLKNQVRLLWSARPLWWKNLPLAFRVVERAKQAGVRLKLTVVTKMSDQKAEQFVQMARSMNIAFEVDFQDYLPRDEFLALVGRQHAFLYPSLHDSGGIPILEAYAQGVPSFTLGLGGLGTAASPDSGLNKIARTPDEWCDLCVERLEAWQSFPERWLTESDRAHQRSKAFTGSHIDEVVGKKIRAAVGL